MKLFAMLSASALILGACSQAETAADNVETQVDAGVEAVAEQAEAVVETLSPDQDVSTLPAGAYLDEDGHAYIAFSYSHQGYSNPILRFNGDAFEARMNLVPDNPTASTVSVMIDPAQIDSGVSDFDEHLVGSDMFDVENHPEISFASTSLSMDSDTTGTLVGDLTMKGITKPVVLDVTLNKVGKHFRSEAPLLGVSAMGKITRSEWDLGYATPFVGDEVDLVLELEFQPEEFLVDQ
jgi:polyisoprenoid-binding protein YceI